MFRRVALVRIGDSEKRNASVIVINIPEDGILDSHLHENLKSYIALTGWDL
jgi:hypothetical protein